MIGEALVLDHPIQVLLFVTAHDWTCNHLASLLDRNLFRSEVVRRLHLRTRLESVMVNVDQPPVVLGRQLALRLVTLQPLLELGSLVIAVSTFFLVLAH